MEQDIGLLFSLIWVAGSFRNDIDVEGVITFSAEWLYQKTTLTSIA